MGLMVDYTENSTLNRSGGKGRRTEERLADEVALSYVHFVAAGPVADL